MSSQTTTLSVSGMHCASCAARVERVLQAAPGVTAAAVNLASETATVSWNAPQQSVQQLSDMVTKAGFQATPANANSAVNKLARDTDQADTLTRQVIIAACLTLPVFLVEMGSHFSSGIAGMVETTIGRQNSWIMQFVLITLVMIWPGRSFFLKGWPTLLRGVPDMNSLVALGTTAAWGYSTVALLFPNVLPQKTHAVYFEAVGVIITLVMLGRLLESRAKSHASDAIRALVALQPKTAMAFANGAWTQTPREELVTGDLIRLRPGEAVATDGIVETGQSWVDESMLTGEATPVAKAQGDTITGGTLNSTGTLEFRATATGKDTVLAGIVRMVAQAQGAKLPIQSVVDQVIRWFVPAILLVAGLTMAIWLVFGSGETIGLALVATVSVLIVACPCAMGLATPTSITVATGRAAELGVLFRKGEVLQTLQDATIVAFDKTGTLTQGAPTLTTIKTADTFETPDVLQLAASLEALSEHPLSGAITKAAEEKDIELLAVTNFASHTGMGVSGNVDGREVTIGNNTLMAEMGINLSVLDPKMTNLSNKAETPIYIAVNKDVAALIGVSDPIKPDAADVISALHTQGIQTALITGDAEETAHAVASALGIGTIRAGLLPGEKSDAVAELKSPDTKIAFVGDGINDAPALSAADIGIALGTGTEVAIDTADVVLISGALSGVARAIQISRATMRNIRQNLFWAFAYNVALIPVAAGVLYPLTGTLLSPMLAAGAMALSSVFVVTNALRLRRIAGALA